MSIDISSLLPNALPLPISGATWAIISIDDPISVPLMGQFEPQVKRNHGEAMWVKKPGILGGSGWVRFIGRNLETLKFTFHAISNSVVDMYPSAAWQRLRELSLLDPTLGRPHKVYFIYGFTIVQAYITSIPEAPIEHWLNTRMPREIGPVEIELTIIPGQEPELSISTNYVAKTEVAQFEDLARTQYGDATLAHSLAEFNQGIKVGDTLSLPRKGHPKIVKIVSISPYFDVDS